MKRESPPANILNLMLTSFPVVILISFIWVFFHKVWWFILFPVGFAFLIFILKPLEKCHICNREIVKKVEGLYEFHVQCDCVKNRWRPIWHSKIEDWHRKVFK